LGKLAANICRYLSGHASVIVEVNVTSAAIKDECAAVRSLEIVV
jgi:hypothetical protein